MAIRGVFSFILLCCIMMKQPLTEKGLKQRSHTVFHRQKGKKSNEGHISFPRETLPSFTVYECVARCITPEKLGEK